MLSIGEFSKICKVSTKTLRYYEEIGLIEPDEVNPENGYRYYSIHQLKKMIYINRLKTYHFSLEEIKDLLSSNEENDNRLLTALHLKKKEIEQQMHHINMTLEQLTNDLSHLEQGKSIMSYLDQIDVQLVEFPDLPILSVRKMVQEDDFPNEYKNCFGTLLRKIANHTCNMIAPPMVLFHSSEFSPFGLDTEFAIPVNKEHATRIFDPGLCLKTVVHGSYTNLSSVYTKQIEWAEINGYIGTNALFEVYVTDPSDVLTESDLITEVYYPVKKKASHANNKQR